MKHYGLIGFPLSHSFSKKYFTEKFITEKITDCTFTICTHWKTSMICQNYCTKTHICVALT
jgi:hypothetical protein